MPTLQKIRFSVPKDLTQLTDRLNAFVEKWYSQLSPVVAAPAAAPTTQSIPSPLPTVNGSALTFGTNSNQLTSWAGIEAGQGVTIGPDRSGKYVFISTIANYDEPFTASPFTIPVFSGWLFLDAAAGPGADFIANLPPATGTQDIVVVKKMDANPHNIAIRPNGTDTIDDLNAPFMILDQYYSYGFRDAALGKWRIDEGVPLSLFDASFVTVNPEPSLPHSRQLVEGPNIGISDAGPGGLLTIGSTGGGGAGFTVYIKP